VFILYLFLKYKRYVYISYVVMFINIVFFYLWWLYIFLYFALICLIYAKACYSIALYNVKRLEESIEQVIELALCFFLLIALLIHISL